MIMKLSDKLKIEVVIWGSGPSSGVPAVNFGKKYWGECDPKEIYNKRLRSSVFISVKSEVGEFNILIDASPDFREQYFRFGQGAVIDALFLSHGHYDHIAGINEFKFLTKSPNLSKSLKHMPLYSSKETLAEVIMRYNYLFKDRNKDLFKTIEIDDYKLLLLGQNKLNHDNLGKVVQVMAIPGEHGNITSTGFRIGEDMNMGKKDEQLYGGIAYSPDISALDKRALTHLQNLDLWIVNCIGPELEFGHSHLENTLNWINKTKPKQTILTNLGLKADYKAMSALLSEKNITLAYDGYKKFL